MMKLRINPIVAEDLKIIKEYIAEDNEEMAVNTIQEIYARIENILGIEAFWQLGNINLLIVFEFDALFFGMMIP